MCAQAHSRMHILKVFPHRCAPSAHKHAHMQRSQCFNRNGDMIIRHTLTSLVMHIHAHAYAQVLSHRCAPSAHKHQPPLQTRRSIRCLQCFPRIDWKRFEATYKPTILTAPQQSQVEVLYLMHTSNSSNKLFFQFKKGNIILYYIIVNKYKTYKKNIDIKQKKMFHIRYSLIYFC